MAKVTIENKLDRTRIYIDDTEVKGVSWGRITIEPDSMADLELHFQFTEALMVGDARVLELKEVGGEE